MSTPFEPSDDSDGELAAPSNPVVRSRLAKVLDAVEGGLLAFFATLLSIGLFGLVLLITSDLATDDRHFNTAASGRRLCALAFAATIVLWLCLDVPLLLRVWPALMCGRRPVAVHAALGQRRYWWWLRPIIALWWLGHFLLGFVGAVGTERMPAQAVANGRNPEVVVVYFLVFTYTLAANGFLLQAFRAMGASERVLERVWHWRILIDAGVLLAGFAVGRAA